MTSHQRTTQSPLHFGARRETDGTLETNDDQDVRTVMRSQESKHVGGRSFIHSFISFILYEATTKAGRKAQTKALTKTKKLRTVQRKPQEEPQTKFRRSPDDEVQKAQITAVRSLQADFSPARCGRGI